MQLDIGRVISNEKFVLEFSTEADFKDFDIAGSNPFSQPVKVSGTVKNKFSGIELNAKVEAHCESVCDRCLKPVSFDIENTIYSFIDYESEKESEDAVILKNGRFLILDDALNEALLFAYPAKVLCKEDCKGLCLNCGADLNIEDCNCLISE